MRLFYSAPGPRNTATNPWRNRLESRTKRGSPAYNPSRRCGECVAPLLGNVNAPAHPDLVVRLHVVQKALQAAQSARFTHNAAVHAYGHHFRPVLTLRLALAVGHATETQPALAKRKISPHTIRHTTAMHLLQAGVDTSVIALWLGHESPVATHHYVAADLAMKERALARLHEPSSKTLRFRAPDSLLNFLRTL